jgi:hypothetical protein
VKGLLLMQCCSAILQHVQSISGFQHKVCNSNDTNPAGFPLTCPAAAAALILPAVCPPGTAQFLNGTTRSCQPCAAGSFCPGGDPKARRPTDNIGGAQVSCNINNGTGLTTKSQRSTRRADCSE